MIKELFNGLLKSIKNPYASIMSEGCIYDKMELIDTGNFLFNAQISGSFFGGFPSNKIFILAGEQATGKTFIMLSIMKHFLNSNENNHIILFETEGAIDKRTIEERNIDSSRIMIVPISTVEEFKTQSIQLVKSIEKLKQPPNLLFGLDSIGMLASEKETDDAISGKSVADMTRAKQLKSAFRILTLIMAKNNIPLIATNHTYQSMTGFAAKKNMGGGTGAYYSASTIAFLGKGQVKTSGILTGTKVFCKLEKSRLTKEKSKIEFNIDFSNGICPYSGLLEFCLEHKWISTETKSKHYYFPEFPENKVSKKDIMKSPELFFTKEILEMLDPRVSDIFKYGSPIIFTDDDDENHTVDDENSFVDDE